MSESAFAWKPRLGLPFAVLVAILAHPTWSAPLPPRPVSVLLPAPVPGCIDSVDLHARASWEEMVQRSGAFRVLPGASAVVQLKVDTVTGRCRLGAQLVDDELSLESRRMAASGQKATDTARWAQVLAELSSSWFQRKAGAVELSSQPAGIEVFLDGQRMGATPLRLDRLLPGRVEIALRSPGWEEEKDTLEIQAGTSLRREHAMRRTRAWLDSVHRAEVERRRDSVWSQARQSPSQALPDLFSRLANTALPGGRQTVAILPFQTLGKGTGGYDPGVMAAEYGIARFSRDSRFQVVEREGLNRLLQEQALTQAGVASDSGAAAAGRILSARYLVGGTVSVEGDRQTFSARMVSVETGEVVSAAVATLGQDRLEELYRTAIGERGQLSGSLYRSAAGPGWGQFYTNHPVHGGVALGAFAAAVGYSVWCWTDYSDKDNTLRKFRNHDPSLASLGDRWVDEANAARKDRNDASSRFGWSLGLVGLAWAGNLVDAGILGWQESRRIRAEYFALMPQAELGPRSVRLSWVF